MSAHRSPVRTLGPRAVRSPLDPSHFIADEARVLNEIELPRPKDRAAPRYFERAGARASLYFDPRSIHAGVVTAGGVCPGINDVIRAIVLELHHGYGVRAIQGYRYGFAGLLATPLELTPETVSTIHMHGGTFLGTARGAIDTERLVDGLLQNGTDVLFAIGGDGTMRAAHAIAAELDRRSASVAVVGIPKTIDNDIPWVDKTFGFDSAVASARIALEAAHAEATSARRGVALVRLMGRNAGFVAAQATLASHDVNACLVPEVPFELPAFLDWLERRLDRRGHAVVVVAEGCSIAGVRTTEHDPSGNVHLAADERDVGRALKRAIEGRAPLTLKYIDPSYIVRAGRATAEDAVFCDALGRHAVHAGMAGKTDLLIGRWHRHFTHVALTDVLGREKRLDPKGALWRQVREATGQPSFVASSRRAPSEAAE